MDNRVVGVLGAGQLGRMFVEAASRLNVQVRLLDVGHLAPAKQIAYLPDPSDDTHARSLHVDGSFSDAGKIRELAQGVDVLTVEIEHVDAHQLQLVSDPTRPNAPQVHPSPATIKLIQDKYLQKLHLEKHHLPLAEFVSVGGDVDGAARVEASATSAEKPARTRDAVVEAQLEGVQAAVRRFGLPLMLKSRTQAYDGRGNYVLRSSDTESARSAIRALGDGTRALYAERWAPFEREVAVMVVRSASGAVRSYPAVETVHRDNICHSVFAPLRHADPKVARRARRVAEAAVATFEGAGVFGVEMFLMPAQRFDDDDDDNDDDDDEPGTSSSATRRILINEIAPRPHNSGHYTIEACETSQYENHLRAILDLPLGGTRLKVGAAAMVNLLGLADLDGDAEAVAKTFAPAVASLRVPGATVHLYGKSGCRRGRKMGHVTVVGSSEAEVAERLKPILDALEEATAAAESGSPLPSHLQLQGVVSAVTSKAQIPPPPPPNTTTTTATTAATLPAKTASDFSHAHPLVGVIMGSDSDLPVMLPCAEVLKRFGVPFELSIVSAHRTPDRMRDYARSASSRGLRCVVAGAGGAAHLPGMVAAQTALPVIGVPVRGSSLDGVDSLHSIVQMPRGVPVATVAINNATNAGLLAVRMLGASQPELLAKMESYMREMEAEVMAKVERLEREAWDYAVAKK